MKLRITVEGNTYEVDVEVIEGAGDTHVPGPPTYRTAGTPPVPQSAPPAPASPPAREAESVPAATSDKVIKSPISGAVLQVKVKPGDTVQVNQVVLLMEAMKMETNVASPIAGTIKAVNVRQGDAVKQDQLLVEFV